MFLLVSGCFRKLRLVDRNFSGGGDRCEVKIAQFSQKLFLRMLSLKFKQLN